MTRYILTVLITSFLSVLAGYTTGYVAGWETGLKTGQADQLMRSAGIIMKHYLQEKKK